MGRFRTIVAALLPATAAGCCAAGLVGLFVSPRWIALPPLVLLAVLTARCPKGLRPRAAAALLFLAALASPLDLGLPGGVRGNVPPGVSIVRAVHGMPAHTHLLRTRGAYFALGCAGRPGLSQPTWVVAWRW